jgi:feruloyl-CoA synthase
MQFKQRKTMHCTPSGAKRPVRPVHVASLASRFDHRDDGVIYVQSLQPLGEYELRLTDRLEFWSRATPDRVFLAQNKQDGDWQTITYSEFLRRVRQVAAGLLRRGLSKERPLMILSGNSIDHALLAVAAMYVGIPYAPVSPAYSLAVNEFRALTHVRDNFRPGIVFVDDGKRFERALKAICRGEEEFVFQSSAPDVLPCISLSDLETSADFAHVERANGEVGPDTVAKVLYTSGSTGLPKGVITTHRMLCANQKMISHALPCLAEAPPVLCDWLPWHHTFGGSHNFGIVLHHGGTLFIDSGKPMPELFGETARNLRDVAPTAYFNVPRGYELLVQHLRTDTELRAKFFSRVQLLFFAAAGLGQRVWDELQDLAYQTCGEEILMVTALGATETAPGALYTGADGAASGHVGLPAPGVELKLVPTGESLELRLRGPSITPGYWRRPELKDVAFDEEGFYRSGDAIRFLDAAQPPKGFLFDGRLDEDFKMATGTWVRVSALRMQILAHFGDILQDVVIAGPDRDYLGALFFPALGACRQLCRDLPADAAPGEVFFHPEVLKTFQERLNSIAMLSTGQSTCIVRAMFADRPPSIEKMEITDKGSINQRMLLKNRAEQIDELFRQPASPWVFVVNRGLICHDGC